MNRLLTLLLGGTLVACSSTPPHPRARVECDFPGRRTDAPGPALVSADGVVLPIPADAVIYQDRALERQVAVQSLAAHPTPARTVRVAVRLANCGAADVQLRLRTSFLDGALRAAEPASAWQTVFVPGGGMASYEELSLSTGASRFFIELDSSP